MKKQQERVEVDDLAFPCINRFMKESQKQVLVETNQSGYLELQNISYGWKIGKKTLNQCNLSISSPGLWMVVGSNGSGKSTLFRLINGMLLPKTGQIHCMLKTALVFQNPEYPKY